MKKSFLLSIILASVLLSCSPDDSNCEAEKQAIRDYYDAQIQSVRDNPGVNGVDYAQIILLQQEKAHKLETACD